MNASAQFWRSRIAVVLTSLFDCRRKRSTTQTALCESATYSTAQRFQLVEPAVLATAHAEEERFSAILDQEVEHVERLDLNVGICVRNAPSYALERRLRLDCLAPYHVAELERGQQRLLIARRQQLRGGLVCESYAQQRQHLAGHGQLSQREDAG